MARRKGFFSRLADAVRHVFTGEAVSPEPRSRPVPVKEPAKERPLPSTGAIPGLSHANDDTFDERADRRRLVRQIMDWFNRENAYWDKGLGLWVNEHGTMRSPARLSTVVANISDFTTIEVEFGLTMSRSEWQDLASRIEGYWYH